MLRYLLPALALLFFAAAPAAAHFFGATNEIDGYQVIFAPYPESPGVGQDSTLNFSVLENGANLFNIYAAVKVQDRSTGEIIFQDPYRQYEISDITVPYVFAEQGDYAVILETRIPGHEKYPERPLTATFALTAYADPPLGELLIYYVAPAAVAIAAITVYLHSRK